MDIGIGLPSTITGITREELLEWARRAEARGFSTLGTLDRIVYGNYEPIVTLAAVAAVTDRIRLATAILIAPVRGNGTVLGKQLATLQAFSGGRITLGVAVGGRPDDYEAAGIDFSVRGKAFDAILADWQQIWSGESMGTAGPVGPSPGAHPPQLIIGGTSAAAFRRVGEHADGWIMGGGAPDQFREGAAKAAQAWAQAGRDGAPRTMSLAYFALGDDARADADRYLTDYYAFLGDMAGRIAGGAAVSTEMVQGYVQGFADAGCDELILFPCSRDPAQVDLLADAVL